MEKPTVVFDFDGVVHSYSSGWMGATVIPDPPVDGIKEVIDELRKDYKVIIVSTRSSDSFGREAMRRWLNRYDIKVDGVMATKPPAFCYIDDRAICFDGKTEGLVEKVKTFKTWLNR